MPEPLRANAPVRPREPGRELTERVLACLVQHIGLEALVLFGSRARGDSLDESDWDLAVVSAEFEGLNPLQRGLRVLDCMIPGAELVCLTPTELLEPRLSYLRCAVLEEGVPLYDRGPYREARERYLAEKAAGHIRFRGKLVEFPAG